MPMKQNTVKDALRALKNGDVIIYPTDTLYALGADIYNEEAVRKIYELKQRPFSSPLPVAVGSPEAIETVAFTNKAAKIIIERFLPGTLTIILKKRSSVPDVVTSSLKNIAVRIPDNPIALDLLNQFGPLTVTSANIHDEKTPGSIQDIQAQLHSVITVCLDDGTHTDEPSTIVDLTSKNIQVIRAGPITEKELREAITNG
jgi:L-threonylcarbamoyladenylate synthase